MDHVEFTVVVIKPDAIERGLESLVTEEIGNENLATRKVCDTSFSLAMVQLFYRWERIDNTPAIETYLCNRPLPVLVVYGVDAINKVLNVKKRLRIGLCIGRLKNLFHCSGTQPEAEWEYKLIRQQYIHMNTVNTEKKEKTNNQVEAIVFRQSPTSGIVEYLILKRNPQKGGFWQPVTGNVEVGEPFEMAAIREVREELGIKEILELIDTGFSFEFVDDGRKQLEKVFGVRVSTSQEITLSPEHTEFKWVPKEVALDVYLKYTGNKTGLTKLHEKLSGAGQNGGGR